MSETMSNADQFWLCMDEPVNLMVITSVMEFDEPLDYNRFYATIDSRLACFPRFKKRVVKPMAGIGSVKWVLDKHFDLRSHLHRIALPSPGDKQALQEVISSLKTKSLDYNKPLWDIHLIENYKGGCALFFRIHHCIADGIALMHTLLSTADSDPNAPWPEVKKEPSKRTSDFAPLFAFNSMMNNAKEMISVGQKAGKGLLKEVEKCITKPSHLLDWGKLSAGMSTDLAKVLSKYTIMNADPKSAFKGKLGIQKRVTWTDPIPLDNIKKVGKAISTATLNDVLVATVTGAMRRYLITRNTSVNELDIHVAVPVNVRKPGTEFELGNKFSLVFLRLPIYIEDPVLRLKEVKRRMDALKVSPDPYINFGLLNVIGTLPSPLALKTAQIFGNKASGVLTNVPGPRVPLYFAGKKISNIMFWVPRSGSIGLGVSILSYNGNVTIGIASDEKLMPDPETMLEGVEDEFNALVELVHSGKIYDEPLVINDRYEEAKARKSQSDDAERNSPGASITKKALPKGSDTASKESVTCAAITKSGKRCALTAMNRSKYCHIHQDAEADDVLLHDVEQIMKELAE